MTNETNVVAGRLAIFRINYKSDFILTLESDAGWMTPFCIKFWTVAPSQAYYAGWDGETYTHCSPVEGDPSKLQVQFDDHHLPIGDLKYQIGYHFTVADFPTTVEDEVLNQETVVINNNGRNEKVMLDFNGETAPDIQFSLPAYANEAQRIANEQQRIANEQQRIANEQQRIQQESARVSEFGHIQDEALADHRRAESDHSTAVDDHRRADSDHETAVSDHQTAGSDHTQAGTDHATAVSDHQTAAADHTQAGTDHATAVADHQTAAADHTQAGNDHTRAENDHTRVESDLAAVELYTDSLGAYDISAAHAVGGVLAKYANLTAALGTNGANIPDSIKKGGMSVKFVQSSDNKYVQYRLMADEWSTTVADWQGVDKEITEGSKNLAESGAVKEYTDNNFVISKKDSNFDVIVKDKEGNCIFVIKGGQIITAGFNSSDINNSNIKDNTINGTKLLDRSVGKEKLYDVPEESQIELDTDLLFADPNGNVVGGFRNGHIESKYPSPYIFKDNYTDFDVADKEGNIILRISKGHIYTKNFSSDNVLPERNTIYCVGDSVTAGGQLAINPLTMQSVRGYYPTELQYLIPNKEIVNLGVGGENISEIFARMGWEGTNILHGFTLKGDCSTTLLSTAVSHSTDSNLVSAFDGVFTPYFIRQGTGIALKQMQTVYVLGIECALTYDNSNENLYINRKDAVDYDVDVPDNTLMSFKGAELGLKDSIFIIRCGYNGDTRTPALTFDELAEKYINATKMIPSGRFIVLGNEPVELANVNYWRQWNDTLKRIFGARFIDLMSTMSSYQALYEQGVTPTTDADISAQRAASGVYSDVYAIEHHLKPSSFWANSYLGTDSHIDATHSNILGYKAVALQVYRKLKQLGWA